jgi:hypothetical protein
LLLPLANALGTLTAAPINTQPRTAKQNLVMDLIAKTSEFPLCRGIEHLKDQNGDIEINGLEGVIPHFLQTLAYFRPFLCHFLLLIPYPLSGLSPG